MSISEKKKSCKFVSTTPRKNKSTAKMYADAISE